jgi:hypothetical protein
MAAMFFSAATLYICMMLAMAYTFMQRKSFNRSLAERDPQTYRFLMDKNKPPIEARNDLSNSSF